jgi:hypothetical protein
MKSLREMLQEFLTYVDSLEIMVEAAKAHIKDHLDVFSPKELDCLVMDGLISAEDVPPKKRTEFIRGLCSVSKKAEEAKG